MRHRYQSAALGTLRLPTRPFIRRAEQFVAAGTVKFDSHVGRLSASKGLGYFDNPHRGIGLDIQDIGALRNLALQISSPDSRYSRSTSEY